MKKRKVKNVKRDPDAPIINNFVSKNGCFNRGGKHIDKKKESKKRGYNSKRGNKIPLYRSTLVRHLSH